MGGGDRVDVSGEVEIDIPHGVDLRVSPSGGSPFDSEGRADGGLPEGPHDVLSETSQSLDKADGGDGLPLPGGSGRDSRDHDQLSVLAVLVLVDDVQGHFGDIFAVRNDLVLGQSDLGCNLFNGFDLRRLGDVYVSLHDRYQTVGSNKTSYLFICWTAGTRSAI